MNTNEIENIDSSKDELEELEVPAEDATPEEKDEYVEKVESLNKQLFARLQKAKGLSLVDGIWVKKEEEKSEPEKKETKDKPKDKTNDSEKELSQKDLIAVMKANIPEEDIEEVVEYARFRKISVSEAMQSPVIKNILSEKAEVRKTADVTNTNGGKRGSSKLSDEALYKSAKEGKMPENEDDIKRLTQYSLRKGRE